MSRQVFVLFDPVSNTKVTWDMEGEERFGITVRNAVGKLVNKIAEKTGEHPIKILTGESAQRFVIRIEPKGNPGYDK